MDVNPYESPAPASGQHYIGSVVLRLFAIVCWLASLLPVFAFLLIVNRPDVAQKREANFSLFVAVCLAMFAFPATGLALFGIAGWWRVRWAGVLGFIAFLPIILWTLAARFWPR